MTAPPASPGPASPRPASSDAVVVDEGPRAPEAPGEAGATVPRQAVPRTHAAGEVGVPVFAPPTGVEAEVIVLPSDPRDGVEGTITASDGTPLRTLRWQPETAPWANLLLVHGLGEHAGRYRHVGRQLAAAGIDVFAYDHRGFGGSGGSRAYVDAWSQLHGDLHDRMTELRARSPDLPLVLYGHSLGGLIVLGYVLATPRPPLPDRLVLSAPGIESTVPRWKFALAGLVEPILPKLRVGNGFARGTLSRDPAVEARHAVDPLVQRRTSVRFATLADREQQRVKSILDGPGRLPVTTYVIHGTGDRIVPVGATETLQGRPNVTRHIYRDLRHELHNEPEGAFIYQELIEWLRGELRGPV